jgi:hypothetical protein
MHPLAHISTLFAAGGYVINVLLAAVVAGFCLGQALPHLHFFHLGCVAATGIFEIIERRPAIDLDGPGATLPVVSSMGGKLMCAPLPVVLGFEACWSLFPSSTRKWSW